MKLMFALGFNPVHCLDCNLEIEPEELDLSTDVVEDLASWNGIYGAIERLWLDSRGYEDWAARELRDMQSEINIRGLELRTRLEAVARCYYWYHHDESQAEYGTISSCPSCGGALQVYDAGTFSQLLCEDCRIVAAGE